MEIDALLVCLNEERFIEAWINNLYGKVDRMIIVDTGSTDSTIEIIKEYILKGYPITLDYWKREGEPYTNGWHEGDCRNYALSLCTNDWILWQDADELITDNFREIVEKKLEHIQGDSFIIPFFALWGNKNKIRCSVENDTHWHPQGIRRIFRRTKIKWNNAKHHCTLTPIDTKCLSGGVIEGIGQIHYHYAVSTLKVNDNRRGDVGCAEIYGEVITDPDWNFDPASIDNYTIKVIDALGVIPESPKAEKYIKGLIR